MRCLIPEPDTAAYVLARKNFRVCKKLSRLSLYLERGLSRVVLPGEYRGQQQILVLLLT